MPRYFFHVDDGAAVAADELGTDLADLNAARAAAVTACGEVLTDEDGDFWDKGASWQMHVTDEADCLLFTLRVSSLEPSGGVRFKPVAVAPR